MIKSWDETCSLLEVRLHLRIMRAAKRLPTRARNTGISLCLQQCVRRDDEIETARHRLPIQIDTVKCDVREFEGFGPPARILKGNGGSIKAEERHVGKKLRVKRRQQTDSATKVQD